MKESLSIDKKYLLTISEGIEYFNIGESKLRELIRQHDNLAIYNGVKILINKKKFEQFLDETYTI